MLPHRHPLLLAVDEFASLGRMEPLEMALSKSAGAGITALLILAAYGLQEAVTGHCQVISAYAARRQTGSSSKSSRYTYSPNNAATADWLSRKTGNRPSWWRKYPRVPPSGRSGRSQRMAWRTPSCVPREGSAEQPGAEVRGFGGQPSPTESDYKAIPSYLRKEVLMGCPSTLILTSQLPIPLGSGPLRTDGFGMDSGHWTLPPSTAGLRPC
jgi:TraM recognition site of TraD and TraG